MSIWREAWSALHGVSTLDHWLKWVAAVALVVIAVQISKVPGRAATRLANWALLLMFAAMLLSLARWLDGQAWTMWALVIAGIGLLVTWADEQRKDAIGITGFLAGCIGFFWGVHWLLERDGWSQPVGDAVFLAGIALLLAGCVCHVIRPPTESAPEAPASTPPDGDAQRNAAIHARLDSSDAQDGADKYMRE